MVAVPQEPPLRGRSLPRGSLLFSPMGALVSNKCGPVNSKYVRAQRRSVEDPARHGRNLYHRKNSARPEPYNTPNMRDNQHLATLDARVF